MGSSENAVPNLNRFMAEYDCKANRARARLEAGKPATVFGQQPKGVYKYVMSCTSRFHHLDDFIELNQTEVGMLLPELSTLTKNLETIERMAPNPNYDFNHKLKAWTQRLNVMPAHKKLSDEDAAQLKLDLNTSFQELESAFTD